MEETLAAIEQLLDEHRAAVLHGLETEPDTPEREAAVDIILSLTYELEDKVREVFASDILLDLLPLVTLVHLLGTKIVLSGE